MKPFTALFLCLHLSIQGYNAIANAQEYVKFANGVSWTYTVSNGAATVTHAFPAIKEIDIPADFDGIPIAHIGEETFGGNTDLTAVVCPTSLLTIGRRAFNGCVELSSVSFSTNLISIGDLAFRYCENLTDISLPPSLREIGTRAFEDTRMLKSLTIPPDVKRIGEYAFCHSGITNLVVECGTEPMEYSPFHMCDSLNRVTLCKSIGNETWRYFDSFHDGSCNIKTLVITNYQGRIDDALSHCNTINTIIVGEGVTELGGSWICNQRDKLTTIVLPSTLTNICNCAFVYCSRLTNLVLNARLNRIGSSAFRGCTSLQEIDIPDGVSNIPESAFRDCTNLSRVVFGRAVTNIDSCAFAYCSSLPSVIIPDSVISIRHGAFDFCQSITNITLGKGLRTIEDLAFTWHELIKPCHIYINSPAEGLGMAFIPMCDSGEMHISFSSSVGHIPNYSLPRCAANVRVKDGITNIDDYAFASGFNLKHLSLPESISLIGRGAFQYCESLESIRLPSRLEHLAAEVFVGCKSLKSISIPSSVTNIGECAFSDCTSLESINFEGDAPIISNGYIGSPNSICTAYVNKGSNGWGCQIPGRWNDDIYIAYKGSVLIPCDITWGGVFTIDDIWSAQFPSFREKFGDNTISTMTKPTGKFDPTGRALCVWEDYVAGTDPTNTNDMFSAAVTLVNGEPIISWSPKLPDDKAALRTYTTYGKTSLTDVRWNVVDGDAEKYNFFKVTVEMK